MARFYHAIMPCKELVVFLLFGKDKELCMVYSLTHKNTGSDQTAKEELVEYAVSLLLNLKLIAIIRQIIGYIGNDKITDVSYYGSARFGIFC